MVRAPVRCMGEQQHQPASGASGLLTAPRMPSLGSTGQAVDFLSGFALQPGSSCADCAALQSLGSLQYQQRIVHAILKRRLAAAAAALAAVAAHATVIDPVDRVASEQQKALLRRVRRRLF